MHADQNDALQNAEHNNVCGWREQTVSGAMIEEVRSILVLHNCLNAQNHGVPQRYRIQWDSLMYRCSSIKLVITI